MNPLNPFSTEPLRDDDLLAVSDDGCPAAPDGRAVPPWLRAEKKWRVVSLARGQTQSFPPPSGQAAEEFVEEDHLVGSGFQPPMVVLGPAGAGLTSFHRWSRLRVERAGVDLVELDFARIAQTDDPVTQRNLLASSWLGSNGDPDLASADLAGMLDRLLLPGSPDAPSNDRPRAHILLRVDRFHRDNKEILLGRLRDLVERRIPDGARFVVLAHETAPLEQTEPFSSFLAVCDVYRLADFTVGDVEAMWRDWVLDRADQAGEVAQKCIEWTGGQPVLVNLYLERLFDVTDVDKKIESQSFDQVSAWLEEHPPGNALQHWQGELARIVGESSLLRRKVGSFLAGQVRENVTREELPLFLAGWIGQDAEGRWAIRSKAHARWAAGPLRAPERYYRAGGDGR
ncbi:MAG: hypothetical protein GY856_17590 [bacterium]|nr:hypothetical protein [bacterium]